MKVRVCHDLVLIRPERKKDVSDGGIHMVHARRDTVDRGTVVALGDGPVTAKGVRLPHSVAVGDLVLFSPDVGEQLIFEKEEVICLREDNILAVVTE